MDPIVHFEIPVENLDRARKFYAVFGWQMEDYPMPDGSVYVGIRTTPVDEKTRMPTKPGAINGGMMKRTAEVKAPVFAINVPSVDESIKQIEAAGGKTIKAKSEVGGMGYYAYIADTEGNVLGLWEDIKK